MADFETVPRDDRAAILGRFAELGIMVEDEGHAREIDWFTCRRGRAAIGLAFEPSGAYDKVCFYCGVLPYWRRPLAMRRLFRDVRSAVRTRAVGTPEGPG